MTAPRTCEKCGAHLDAGEVCECEKAEAINVEPSTEFVMGRSLEALPATIDFNFEALKLGLSQSLAKYDGLVVTEDDIKGAKDDRAKLNKLREALEAKRKEVKRECMAPYNDFEAKVKELVALVDKPNPALLQNDPDYITRLASMPEAERKALLYGDWDTFSGQVFTEWRNDSEHYLDRVNTHVIAPFKVPDTWSIWCGMDWGYSKPFSVGWYAVDHERRLYRIREYYGCTGTPNMGVKLEPSEVARQIRRIEAEDPNLKGRTIHRVGDPAIWGSDGTESIGALFERERVFFEKGDHARIDGKMQVHHRLAFDENGWPMLYVFNTCKHFIRTVPNLVYDETDVEDIDTDGEDHIYDELRYVCMKNPIAPRPRKVDEPKPYDPLDLQEKPVYDRYDFFRRY